MAVLNGERVCGVMQNEWTFETDTPLGRVRLGSDGAALTGLWFVGQAHFGEGLSPAHPIPAGPVQDEARALSGERVDGRGEVQAQRLTHAPCHRRLHPLLLGLRRLGRTLLCELCYRNVDCSRRHEQYDQKSFHHYRGAKVVHFFQSSKACLPREASLDIR